MKKKIYDILKEEIITLCLPPGEPLIEEKLAKRFKVSRTPIREVLNKLNHEGLVELIPQKGAFVGRVGFIDVRELFQIREALEGIATKISVSRFTKEELDEFESALDTEDLDKAEEVGRKLHQTILEKAGNKRISSLIDVLRSQIERMYFFAKNLPGREKRSLEEHREILRALKMKNGELAEKAMRKHMVSTLRTVIESLGEEVMEYL